MSLEHVIRLALPGKGALEAATLAFLAECGMKVSRNNPRQYLARISSMPDLEVVFQRAADIPALVQDGDAALGITGYDILVEYRGDGDGEGDEDGFDDDLVTLERDLGYGHCRLVVAVPETWIDVNTCADLWHLAGYYQAHKGRGLRIATKYPALTGQFLHQHGITHCKIISPHGALEAAPLTGTADLIVDLTETGTTLRENHLKLLDDGVVLHSQACFIGNAHLLCQNEQALHMACLMLELIEAHMQARNRSLLTAFIPRENLESVQRICDQIRAFVADSQLQISTPGHETSNLYALSGMVNIKGSVAHLLEIVTAMRSAGAFYIHITPLTYRFAEESTSVRNLRERLKRRHE
ncbi:MAG TPA: ATP phosphoribosyltransferase [Ktedonobacteraceae bacterium]|jgi:ATP phosphoribosyltransferase|nr:ATP phosphoribosyltransferase [Ktedonobacteraceae bacterium]